MEVKISLPPISIKIVDFIEKYAQNGAYKIKFCAMNTLKIYFSWHVNAILQAGNLHLYAL